MTQANTKTQSKTLRRLIAAAVFAAMTCAITAAFPIPMFNGYFNLGDTIVLLGAFLLGGAYGIAAAGIGSGCADLLLGYTVYAPATLVIKALVALTAGAIYRRLPKRLPGLLLAAVTGELVMCAGYFAFECVVYAPATASASLLATNLPQAGINAAIATLLLLALRRSRLLDKWERGF